MKNLKIVISAAGAPGTTSLIRILKSIKERNIYIIGIDSDLNAGGRFLADKFYQVPLSTDHNYIDSIMTILKIESPDLFFVVSSNEILTISKHKEYIEDYCGCKVIVNHSSSIETVSNKQKLYSILEEKGTVPVPKFKEPKSLEQFINAVESLGYPDKPVCFKPYISKGSRGFRILDHSMNRRHLLLNEKPESIYMTLDEFIKIFEADEKFPELLVMEKAEGIDYDAMTLSYKGESLLTTVKTREKSKWGIIVNGELIYSPKHIQYCKEISRIFNLNYNNSIQFIGEKIIEVNPRTSTYIYWEDFNEPYLAIKLCLGEISPEHIKEYMYKIPYGKRLCRYMDQFSFYENETFF